MLNLADPGGNGDLNLEAFFMLIPELSKTDGRVAHTAGDLEENISSVVDAEGRVRVAKLVPFRCRRKCKVGNVNLFHRFPIIHAASKSVSKRIIIDD